MASENSVQMKELTKSQDEECEPTGKEENIPGEVSTSAKVEDATNAPSVDANQESAKENQSPRNENGQNEDAEHNEQQDNEDEADVDKKDEADNEKKDEADVNEKDEVDNEEKDETDVDKEDETDVDKEDETDNEKKDETDVDKKDDIVVADVASQETENTDGKQTTQHDITYTMSPLYRPVDGQQSTALAKRFRLGLFGYVARLFRMASGILGGGAGMLCMLVLSPLRILHPLLKLVGVPRNYLPIDFLQRAWAKWMLFLFGVRVKSHYAEKVPTDKPLLLMFSHSSGIDPFAIVGHSPVSVRLVAKQSLIYVPLFGITGYLYGHIYINRQNRARAIDSLQAASRAITERGTSIAISPEGTRSADGTLLPFKKGPFHLAKQAGCPIAPVVIYDAMPVWPPKAPWPIPNLSGPYSRPVRMIYGDPIYPQEDGTHPSVEELSDAVRKSMLDAVARFEKEFAEELSNSKN
eukprot:TRINITY_DN5848_c0_g1_i2.p1 TRINITY_DN5848_c0_g1~~TRINITY_DN5848_c0_g1_i2.p1  ORF type:complete len:468 (+),score=139.76 TRINITY_DN5848_c0_g1_i2:90-1493(+)